MTTRRTAQQTAIFLCLAALTLAPRPADAGEDILQLREAIVTGVTERLGLKAERLDIAMQAAETTVEKAAFDPALEATVGAEKEQTLTGVVLYEDPYEAYESVGAGVALRKRFTTGLESRIDFETRRSRNNALADALGDQYRNVVVLTLTQPLLRGFGPDVNTTGVKISETLERRARWQFIHQARTLAGRIETAYYDLAGAWAVLNLKITLRNLAADLVRDNQARLDRGVIPVTAVHEARTAETRREEAVIRARQQAEAASNRLKNLLEKMDADEVLYEKPLRAAPLPPAPASFPEAGAAVKTALEKRADIKAWRLTIENQDRMTAYYENQKRPRLDLTASAGLNGLAGEDRPATLLGTPQRSPLTGDYGDAWGSMFEDDGYQWAAGLRFSYPLGNRAADARHAQSRLKRRALSYRLKRLKRDIRTRVGNAHLAAVKSLERLAAAKEFVRLSRKLLDQENRRLNNGLSNTFRVLDYQENLVDARVREVRALTDFHKALAALYQGMGENLARREIVVETEGF